MLMKSDQNFVEIVWVCILQCFPARTHALVSVRTKQRDILRRLGSPVQVLWIKCIHQERVCCTQIVKTGARHHLSQRTTHSPCRLSRPVSPTRLSPSPRPSPWQRASPTIAIVGGRVNCSGSDSARASGLAVGNALTRKLSVRTWSRL